MLKTISNKTKSLNTFFVNVSKEISATSDSFPLIVSHIKSGKAIQNRFICTNMYIRPIKTVLHSKYEGNVYQASCHREIVNKSQQSRPNFGKMWENFTNLWKAAQTETMLGIIAHTSTHFLQRFCKLHLYSLKISKSCTKFTNFPKCITSYQL